MEKRNYYIQPTYEQQRAENQVWQDLVIEKWELLRKPTDTHGNIEMILRFDMRLNRFILLESKRLSYRFDDNHISFARTISSALLLDRLICLAFYPNPFREEPYKVLWSVGLKHKATGYEICLEDYKAGCHLGSVFSEKDDIPPILQKDLLELLDFLVSNQIVHPYDLTVAGSVA
jgi:hypothetical protein